MAGFAFSFFALDGAARQLGLFLFVFPLIFMTGVIRMLLLLGLVSAGLPKLGRWIYYDFFDVFQFVLILSSLWLIRNLLLKWRAVPGGKL